MTNHTHSFLFKPLVLTSSFTLNLYFGSYSTEKIEVIKSTSTSFYHISASVSIPTILRFVFCYCRHPNILVIASIFKRTSFDPRPENLGVHSLFFSFSGIPSGIQKGCIFVLMNTFPLTPLCFHHHLFPWTQITSTLCLPPSTLLLPKQLTRRSTVAFLRECL